MQLQGFLRVLMFSDFVIFWTQLFDTGFESEIFVTDPAKFIISGRIRIQNTAEKHGKRLFAILGLFIIKGRVSLDFYPPPPFRLTNHPSPLMTS